MHLKLGWHLSGLLTLSRLWHRLIIQAEGDSQKVLSHADVVLLFRLEDQHRCLSH